jgi:hypothetical protein
MPKGRSRWRGGVLGLALGLGPIAESGAVEPTVEQCLSSHDESITLRRKHELRAARDALLLCASQGCPDDVRDECTRRGAEIGAAIPTLVFDVKDAAGRDVRSVKVAMDGRPLVDHLDGTAIAVDPGARVFVFEVEGRPPVTRELVIAEGEHDRLERIVVTEPNVPVAPNAETPTRAEPPRRDSSNAEMLRIIGFTSTGLGVVGLGLGIGFELQSASKVDQRNAICPASVNCPRGTQAQIDALTDDARAASTRATVAFVAGSVLAAGGLVALFVAPRFGQSTNVAVTPLLSPAFQGVALEHVF